MGTIAGEIFQTVQTTASVSGEARDSIATSRSEPSDAQDAQPTGVATAVPQPVTSYEISARLDAERHTISGKAQITFTNPSNKSTKKLHFHLYLNAFENDQTLFRREQGGRSGLRGGQAGRIEIHRLTSPRYLDRNLWNSATIHSPGDKNDRTDISVALPAELKAHETIVLNVEFTSFLPQIFERTGYEKSFHLAAQWYPKLAKREVNGTWAHFAFHPYGEFYADFGNYEVSLDVPQDFVVGSTGRLRRLEGGEAGRALYQATATGVHDFAWTAWPEFIVEERSIAGVQVRLLSPANLPLSRQATWKTLERSLPYLEENYGPYPYRQLTVVHPPAFASPAGGMEYPQFITTGGSDWVQALGIRAIELVTVHELGHQWFQGVIATDEMSFPFLDEGLASYAEWRYLTDTYGSTSLVSMGNLRISRIAAGRYTALLGKFDQPIELPASSYESFSRIGSIVYGRMPLALETWARVYSPQKMRAALSGYAKKFRFKHPRPRDFYHTVQMQLGQEAGRALKHYFRRGGTIDLSVGNIETRAIGGGYQSSIQIRRQGDVALPFEVVAEFADRSRVSKAFSGEAKDLNWSLVHESKLESLVIDPEHRILLDENLLNNRVMVRHKKASDHPSFSMRVFAVISFLLAAAAF